MESGNKQHRTLHIRRSEEMLVAEDVERMLALHKNGWGSKRIARELGVARNTVKRYLAAGGYVPYRSPARPGKLAGREVRLHDLRHSFASFLINAGRSLFEVQKLLGHHDPKVTMRYAHLSPQAMLEAVNVGGNVVGRRAVAAANQPQSAVASA